ncbi:MAG: hypothetical protein H6619_05685 [Deltaproteobacteria bacterium]|nr:hypothetical protein [Deltaproteobacteria bacterium]
MRLISLFILSTLIACGGGAGSTGLDSTSSSSASDPIVEKVVTRDYFGTDGNLYKPVSDLTASGAGNMVVLFSAKYTEQFDSCRVSKDDGTTADLICINDQEWTHIPFSCFANGNRQTWRANFKCSSVGEVVVTCLLGTDEYVFEAPNGQTGNVCTRFG